MTRKFGLVKLMDFWGVVVAPFGKSFSGMPCLARPWITIQTLKAHWIRCNVWSVVSNLITSAEFVLCLHCMPSTHYLYIYYRVWVYMLPCPIYFEINGNWKLQKHVVVEDRTISTKHTQLAQSLTKLCNTYIYTYFVIATMMMLWL